MVKTKGRKTFLSCRWSHAGRKTMRGNRKNKLIKEERIAPNKSP